MFGLSSDEDEQPTTTRPTPAIERPIPCHPRIFWLGWHLNIGYYQEREQFPRRQLGLVQFAITDDFARARHLHLHFYQPHLCIQLKPCTVPCCHVTIASHLIIIIRTILVIMFALTHFNIIICVLHAPWRLSRWLRMQRQYCL